MIDPAKVPSTVLFDTGVLLRALGHRPSDPNAALCRELFEAALRGRVLVSALSVAEIGRGQPEEGAVPIPLPRSRHLVVVPFDALCADALAARLPMQVLREAAVASSLPLTYLKFDALLVASAIRWKADCIITLDERLARRYPDVGIPFREPRFFQDEQADIPF